MRVRIDWAPAAGAISGRDAGDWPQDHSRWIGVAIDVLRATSTLTVALANGAARVIPLARPEEALALREREPHILACGERDGRIVPGFDLGNSPLEYSAARVAGRTLAFASTNGSQALLSLAGCGRILLASLLNASAVAERLEGSAYVRIVCAGQQGSFALEDAACAGWLCAALAKRGARLEGGAARAAAALAPRGADEARALLEGCSHGRALRAIGPSFAADVAYCAALDSRAEVFAI